MKVRLVFKLEGRRALWLLLLRLPWRGQVTGSVQIPDVSKIKLTEESVDLGDLVKSLDIAVPSKADEKVELTVPTDADTLVLKL